MKRLEIAEWEKVRVGFLDELCDYYCHVMENSATGRKGLAFGDFELADGSLSPYYFDLRTAYAYPDIIARISEMAALLIQYKILGFSRTESMPVTLPIQRIAGVPNASLGLTALVSLKLHIPWFYWDLKRRYADPREAVQGSLSQGDEVLVLDDLTTAAIRKMEIIQGIVDSGGTVKHVAVILDREEGGEERLMGHGIKLHSIAKAREFAESAFNKGQITKEQRQIIIDYVLKRRKEKGLE